MQFVKDPPRLPVRAAGAARLPNSTRPPTRSPSLGSDSPGAARTFGVPLVPRSIGQCHQHTAVHRCSLKPPDVTSSARRRSATPWDRTCTPKAPQRGCRALASLCVCQHGQPHGPGSALHRDTCAAHRDAVPAPPAAVTEEGPSRHPGHGPPPRHFPPPFYARRNPGRLRQRFPIPLGNFSPGSGWGGTHP